MIRSFLLPLITVMCLVLTGCWDRREINDLAFVTATSLDKAENGIRVGIQFPLPSQLGGTGSSGGGGGGGTEGSGGNGATYVESAVGHTVREANAILQESMSREINFSHRRTVIFGEQLARSGIAGPLDIMARIPQNRMTAFMMVTKGSAIDLLNVQAPMEKMSSELIRELVARSMRSPRSVKDVVNAILFEGLEPSIPYAVMTKSNPGKAGKPVTTVRLEGLAVFNEDRMVGVLKDNDFLGVLFAMNQADRPVITVRAPKGEGYISVRVLRYSVKLKPNISRRKPEFDIRISGVFSVSDNESNARFIAYTGGESKLDAAVNRHIEKIVTEGLDKIQVEYRSDVVGFGNSIYRANASYWRSIRDDWPEIFKNCKIRVHSDIKMENPGSITEPFAIPKEDMVKSTE